MLFNLRLGQLVCVAGGELPDRYRRRLAGFRYGPGAFKVDWALDGPIPWRAPEVARAGDGPSGRDGGGDRRPPRTSVARGRQREPPFVLLVQGACSTATRAPAGKQTAWAYCHVPNGSRLDMTERIEAPVERFAPGFRDRILARATVGTR